jgi:ribosome-binding factor A
MEKVNCELRKHLMTILQKEIDDPTMEFLSITRVHTTKDLQESKVYFSLLDNSKRDKAKQMLDNMKGFIRHELGKRIRLKVLPQLNFIFDDSIEYSVEIHKKIEEIKKLDEDAKK